MTHKAVFIDDGELIVGERGPGPKATPTYPEICTHSAQDLDILNDREKAAVEEIGVHIIVRSDDLNLFFRDACRSTERRIVR